MITIIIVFASRFGNKLNTTHAAIHTESSIGAKFVHATICTHTTCMCLAKTILVPLKYVHIHVHAHVRVTTHLQ